MRRISWSIVRPIVTLAFVAAYIWGFVAGKITSEDFKLLAVVAITWWFTQRDTTKTETPPAEPPVPKPPTP